MMTITVFSQELSKDQLLQLSFDSLDRIENELEYGTMYSKKVFDAHILKAKYAKDMGQLAEAYRKRVWGEDFDTAIQYVDSSIYISKKLTDESLKSRIHYSKGVLLYESDRPQESLKEYITAYEFAVKANNYEHIIDCLNSISGLKREYAQELEAIMLQRKSLELLKEHKEEIDNYDLTHLITLDNISRCYLQVKNIDSAKFYTRKGIDLALKMRDLETYRSLGILDAQINYYDGNYLKAKDSLLKYIEHTEGFSRADALFYLGMIEGKVGDLNKKRACFTEIDSILEENGLPLMDNVKETFQFLLKEAIESREKGLESKYVNSLVYYDSLLGETQRHIRNVTLNEFDLPFQENAERQMKKKFYSEKSKMLYLFSFSLGLSMVILIFFYWNYKKVQRKLEIVMNEKAEPLKRNPKKDDIAQMDIDSEVVQNTLEALDDWEKNLGYLNQKTSQNSLATELGTNTTYLSKIINTYKGQTFSNYLKDLRVTYAVNHLKENPGIIDTHSTIQIAEMFGFNSLDVFTRAIKSKIGLTPALFFKKIKRSNL